MSGRPHRLQQCAAHAGGMNRAGGAPHQGGPAWGIPPQNLEMLTMPRWPIRRPPLLPGSQLG